MEHLASLISAIRKNKAYASLAKDILDEEISRYFRRHPDQQKFLAQPKSEKYKKIVAGIRAELHKSYGSFQAKGKDKRTGYLAELHAAVRNEDINTQQYYTIHDQILATSISAKERLKEYFTLYENIFAITTPPKTILDLGCGINPCSYCYMNLGKLQYHAYDIDEKDMEFLNAYFLLMKPVGLKGDAQVFNLRHTVETNLRQLPRADVCFLFKVLDPLEKGSGHKLSELIITHVPASWVVVSFSTHTVSGRPMNHPYRGWIEQMLGRLGYAYQKLMIPNEIFYVIKK